MEKQIDQSTLNALTEALPRQSFAVMSPVGTDNGPTGPSVLANSLEGKNS